VLPAKANIDKRVGCKSDRRVIVDNPTTIML